MTGLFGDNTHSSSPRSTAADPFVSRSRLFAHETTSADSFVSRMRLFAHETSLADPSVSRMRRLAHETALARLPWATLSYFIVARGYSTARLSDTSARFHRTKVLGKRRKVESDKKKKKSPQKKRGRLRSGAQSRARTGTSLRDIGF